MEKAIKRNRNSIISNMEEEKRKENEKSQWEKGEGIREEGKGIKN